MDKGLAAIYTGDTYVLGRHQGVFEGSRWDFGSSAVSSINAVQFLSNSFIFVLSSPPHPFYAFLPSTTTTTTTTFLPPRPYDHHEATYFAFLLRSSCLSTHGVSPEPFRCSRISRPKVKDARYFYWIPRTFPGPTQDTNAVFLICFSCVYC